MSIENQGDARPLPGMETNGQRTTSNGNVSSSTGEPIDARNLVITSQAHNGNHHSEECGSPEMQSNHQMPPTPITPNTNGAEIDLSRVKQEPETINIKQEVQTGKSLYGIF